jgi:hypothetical protein
MPTYNFIDTETGEEVEKIMSWSQREEFLKNNPQLEVIIHAPALVSSRGGTNDQKAGDGWKEVLSKVAEKHPGSAVAERYGRKSIKESKSAQVVKKHVDRITKRLQNNK